MQISRMRFNRRLHLSQRIHRSASLCRLSAVLLSMCGVFAMLALTGCPQGRRIPIGAVWPSRNWAFVVPVDVVVDSDGNVHVLEQGNCRVQKFSSRGEYIATYGIPGTEDGQFSGPTKLAADDAGHVYVSDTGNSRIQKFSSEGTFVSAWGSSGGEPGQFSNPLGLAVDPAGYLYVADSRNRRVQKFTLSGTHVDTWSTESPSCVATDSEGNVFVGGENCVKKYSFAGVLLTMWGNSGLNNGEFHGVSDIGVDGSNRIYVLGENRIQRFSSEGVFEGVWPSNYTAEYGHMKLYGLEGIFVDESGVVYAAEANAGEQGREHVVWKFSG